VEILWQQLSNTGERADIAGGRAKPFDRRETLRKLWLSEIRFYCDKLGEVWSRTVPIGPEIKEHNYRVSQKQVIACDVCVCWGGCAGAKRTKRFTGRHVVYPDNQIYRPGYDAGGDVHADG
jgi:hypothetical protein